MAALNIYIVAFALLTACGEEKIGGRQGDTGDPTSCEPTQEIPYDGLDQDCDGADLTDVDGDGYDAEQAGGRDCDDDDAHINPGATEACDEVDNDCDGYVDENGCEDSIYLGDLTMTTDFIAAYFCEQYDTVYGSLTISGEGVSDPEVINCLQQVAGNLVIENTLLPSLDLPWLTWVGGDLTVKDNAWIEEADLGALVEVGEGLTFDTQMAMVALDLGSLVSVGNNLDLEDNGILGLLSLDSLLTVGGVLDMDDNDQMTGVSAPALAITGGLIVRDNAELAELELDGLVTVDGDAMLSMMPRLATLEGLTALEVVTGRFDLCYLESLSALDELVSLREVQDYLAIWQNSGLSAVSLPALTTVRNRLNFSDCAVLASVSLPLLTSAGHVAAENLDAFIGFEAPALLSADVSFDSCGALITLDGFPSLVSGGVESYDNGLLENIAFPALTTAMKVIIDRSDGLTNFEGAFPVLETIVGELYLYANDSLQSLDGLEAVRSIGGDLDVEWNEQLTDIEALYGVESVGGDFRFEDNSSLGNAAARDLASAIGTGNIGGSVIVESN